MSKILVLVKKYIWCFLFSAIICSCLFSVVNKIANHIVPKAEVTLTIMEPNSEAEGEQIWIYLIDNVEISEESFNNMARTGTWEFMSMDKGAANNTIVGYGTGSTIKFPISKSCSGGFHIWKNYISSNIKIEVADDEYYYDFFSLEGENIQITPFADNKISILIRGMIYGILIILMTVMMGLLSNYIFTQSMYFKMPNYKYKYIVLGLFIVTYIFDVAWYKHGIVNFNAFGDQPSYWHYGGIFAQIGVTKKAIIDEIKVIPVFRGYGIFLPSFIAQYVGNRLGVDSYLVYFALPSIVAAWLFGYILPKIYELFHEKKPYIHQIVIGFISFFIFYLGNLVSIDGDLFGLVFYVAGVLFIVMLLKSGWIRYSILSGTCFSLALAIRTSYLIGFYIVTVLSLAVMIKTAIEKSSHDNNKTKVYRFTPRKIFAIVFTFFSFFMIFCFPQIYMNEVRGHHGLFAYDQDGVYGTTTTTLLEQGIDTALKGYIITYPETLCDGQIYSIRQYAGYDDATEITMSQGFDAYAQKPLDTLVVIVKRMFAFIDIKHNVTLPNEYWKANTKYYLFSTLNYIFLGTALFCLLSKFARDLVFRKNELFFWSILILGPVAPMLAARIEWRQAMVLYLFYLSYVCAYCFTGELAVKENRLQLLNNKYLAFLTISVFSCHAISLSMYLR